MRPYLQNPLAPNHANQSLNLVNFSGGLNNRSEIIQPHEARDTRNMRFSNDTLMEKRHGFTEWGSFEQDDPITFIDTYRPYTGFDELLTATDGELYADFYKIADVSGKVRGVNVNGRYMFVDGSAIRAYGMFPTEEDTYTNIVGVAPEGARIMQLKSPPENFTPLGSEHVQGVNVYNYTTGFMWYEPCEKELEDTSKAGNVVPESASYIALHDNRLYLSGDQSSDDTIYISDIDRYWYFPAAVSLQVPPNSDKIRGLAVYDDSVIVGRKEDMHSIIGKTNNPELGLPLYQLRKLNTHTGIASQESMTNAHNYLFFLGSDGVAYALSAVRAEERTLITQVLSAQLDLFKHPLSFDKYDFERATAIYRDDEWTLSIGDKAIVYNYRLRAWTYYTNMEAHAFHVWDDTLLWGDAFGTLSQVGQEFLDYRDIMPAVWESGVMDMGDASIHKQFKEFHVALFTYSGYTSRINMQFDIDYASGREELMSTNAISVWGLARFGDRFIDRNTTISRPIFTNLRGRLLTIRMVDFPDPISVPTYADVEAYRKPKNGIVLFVEEDGVYYEYVQNELSWVMRSRSYFNNPIKFHSITGKYEFKHKR